ncbi:hypothetical protein GCM10011586_16280 [Silvibacterium dinghuense]|nr:hypothetical protein GCM10011586_16280 [Silvibacterium dinghuense]
MGTLCVSQPKENAGSGKNAGARRKQLLARSQELSHYQLIFAEKVAWRGFEVVTFGLPKPVYEA